MARKERTKLEVQAERAVLAAVRLPDDQFDPNDPFGELRDLAEQAGAVVVGELTQNLPRPVAGTYIGSGKIDELKALCETLDASVVIFDHDLSPKQLSNIEQAVGRKIIDRSELILDIFAARATTHEAKLQVELAQLEYTYPRLKAMWDHLERISGGGGVAGIGTRGPGEMQLEIDRRLVADRKVRLQRELDEIQARKRREVAARRAEHFTVGIVGYTNAGKSTLFNALTSGGAYADDRLFATLMTRTREWWIGATPEQPADAGDPPPRAPTGEGLRVMLSDTVGFVRDLPHNLVASFKATLEEATHADVLILVLDVSDPAADLHYQTVMRTLDELFDELEASKHEEDQDVPRPPRILVLNKADRLRNNSSLLVWQQKVPGAIPLSAIQGPRGLGMRELADRVRALAEGEVAEYDLTAKLKDAKTISLLESRAKVLDRTYTDDSVILRARVGRRQLEHLLSGGARFEVARADGEPTGLQTSRRKAEPSPWELGRHGKQA
jgi:GTP-binding protein HflX